MMTLTRTDTDDSITLPGGLLWVDKNDWSEVIDTAERTVTGHLVIEPWTRIKGRPITFESESEECGLMLKADAEALQAWTAIAGLEMELDTGDEAFDVMFRQDEEAGLTARLVFGRGLPLARQFMHVTIRLRTI